MKGTILARGAAALLLLAIGRSGFAQGILYPEGPFIREQPFSVKTVRVSATITDGIAETSVEQTFVNNSSMDQEGTYLFPLPEGASVSAFSLRAGDKVIEARMLPKDEARSIYESIVRRRRDPALLEYVGRGLFRSSVFPIPAHGERTLTLRYSEVLKASGGLKRYAYSLSTGRFSSRPVELASVMVRLKSSSPLHTVYSPSHDVSVHHIDDHNATASWEGRGEFPDRDFTLFYSTSADEVGLSLLTYQTGDRDGYFMLIAAPRFGVARDRILPKQVVFVLDRTGSMLENHKLEQARAALNFCLDSLNPQDRFDVVTFNESADVMSTHLVTASADNVRSAHRFVRNVEASGGTNIDEALRAALGVLKREEGRQKMVVFLTDGLPTVGETNVETILANVRDSNAARTGGGEGAEGDRLSEKPARRPAARIFCFGVGYDVNVPFLDRLAEQSRGDADYVRPNESVESIVSMFYAKVSSPVLTDVRLAFGDAETFDVYPRQLPDIFKGSQLIVAGRYHGDPHGTVRLTGIAEDRPVTFTLSDAFGENAGRSGMIPRIWATRKIGYLLDQVRLHSNQEVIDEIVRLSKEYAIITPYTSFLADERQDTAFRPMVDRGGFRSFQLDGRLESMPQLREQLGDAIQGGAAGINGKDATYRALNSHAYQSAGRAPAQAQGAGGGPGGMAGMGGGFGGGGFGGYGGPAGATELGRNQLSLDYFSTGQMATAAKPVAANQEGLKQVQANARVQSVAGRAFYRRGAIWFDDKYRSGEKVVQVRALSDAHFQLLHALPALNKYAAVGDEVILDLGKVAVQIGAQGKEKLTDSDLQELTAR